MAVDKVYIVKAADNENPEATKAAMRIACYSSKGEAEKHAHYINSINNSYQAVVVFMLRFSTFDIHNDTGEIPMRFHD